MENGQKKRARTEPRNEVDRLSGKQKLEDEEEVTSEQHSDLVD